MQLHLFTRIGLIVSTFVLMVMGSTTSARANATTEHIDVTYPIIDQEVIWDCLGDGESILINGVIHIKGHVTYDANGIGHFFGKENMQGVSGVGLLTGTKYQFIDSRMQLANDHLTTSNGKEAVFVIATRVISHGPANNLRDQAVFHMIYNANGELTAYLDKITFDCGSDG
jgi:hypothetical protein